MKIVAGITAIALFSLPAFAAVSAETAPFIFVQEFIQENSEFEQLFNEAAATNPKASPDARLGELIHFSTRSKFALQVAIGKLSAMKLDPRYDEFRTDLIAFYQQKIKVHERLVQIGKAFIAGPRPGMDFGVLAAEMPELRANLDSINESVFKLTPAVFATLIDPKPDPQGHMSRLSITSAERQTLRDQLHTAFGKKMDVKGEQDYFVSSGTVLRSYLSKEKGYKCSDEV